MKIELEVIRDTPANRDGLIYGDGYIVKYYDQDTKKERFAIAIWRHNDFEYPAMKIRTPPALNMVMGWIHVKGIR